MRMPETPSSSQTQTGAPQVDVGADVGADMGVDTFVQEQNAASDFLLGMERKAQAESLQMQRGPLVQRLIDPRLLAAGKSKTVQRSGRLSPAVLPQARRGTLQRAEDDEIDDSGLPKDSTRSRSQSAPLPLVGQRSRSQQAPRSEDDLSDESVSEDVLNALPGAPRDSGSQSSQDSTSVDQLVQESLDTVSAFTGNRPRNFGGGGGSGQRDSSRNLDEIARQILPLIRRMLAIERERRPSR